MNFISLKTRNSNMMFTYTVTYNLIFLTINLGIHILMIISEINYNKCFYQTVQLL